MVETLLILAGLALLASACYAAGFLYGRYGLPEGHRW
jgi:hypothetical protein